MLCCLAVVRMQSASWRLCWTWRTAVLSCLSCLFLLCSTFLPKEEQRSLKGFNSLGMWRWVAGLVLPDVSKERIDCMDCSVRQDIGIHCPTTLPHIRTPESSATPRSRIGLQVYLAACAHWCACVSHIDFSYSHLFFTNLGINTCHWKTLEHCICGAVMSVLLKTLYRLVNSDVSKALRFFKCREILAQRYYIQFQNTSLRNF